MPQIKASSELELELAPPSFERRAERMRAVFHSTDELAQSAARRVQLRRKKRASIQVRRPSRPILYIILGVLVSGGALAWNQDTIATWLDGVDAKITTTEPGPQPGNARSKSVS